MIQDNRGCWHMTYSTVKIALANKNIKEDSFNFPTTLPLHFHKFPFYYKIILKLPTKKVSTTQKKNKKDSLWLFSGKNWSVPTFLMQRILKKGKKNRTWPLSRLFRVHHLSFAEARSFHVHWHYVTFAKTAATDVLSLWLSLWLLNV